jgi:anaerobic selenocysteine-containing dehydrogenase
MPGQARDYLDIVMGVPTDQPLFKASPFSWQQVDPREEGRKETLFGLCRACMQGDCSTIVHLEDGIVVKIEGDREAPPNYGSLCPKGNSEVMSLYNPYRVKAPLVRTNPEKGLDVDPKWKEVTWDEAFDTAAKGLKAIHDEDPRGLIVCEGWGQRDTMMRKPFGGAFGTPNEIGSHGPLCTVHYATSLVHASYPVAIVDLEHCDYHITLGRSLGPNFATSSGVRKFSEAIDRGLHLVVIDPRSSHEASKGEWVPIRPGTDLAFLLSMAHVMLHEIKKWDEWFLKNRTNAPYLIGPDGNYVRDPETGKPIMWDPVDGKAKPWTAEFSDHALIGAYEVNGVKCKTAFDLVRDEMAGYTPEWAEEITTIPAATIRRLAKEFVDHARIGSTIEIDGFTFPFRPVSLNTERNVTNHRGGTYSDLTGKIINMLVGNIEVPGGCLGCGYRGPIMAPTEDGTVTPAYEAVAKPFQFPPVHYDLQEYYPHKHTTPHLTTNAILDPDKYHLPYRIKGWLSVGGNPIRQNAQPEKYVKAFQSLDFVVSIAYHIDEPTILADVVLPEHSSLERFRAAIFYPQHQSVSNEVAGLQMVQLRQPVAPVFNTMHVDDILMELGDRLGILTGPGGMYDKLNKADDFIIREQGLNLRGEHQLDLDRRYTLEEIVDRQLKGWIFNKEGKGLAELQQEGRFVHWSSPKTFYNYYYLPDNQTRHPYYFQHLKNVGDELKTNLAKHGVSFPGVPDDEYVFDLYKPIPHWVPNSEMTGPEDFDLWAINWKTPYFGNDAGNVIGNPWLAEIYTKDPYMAVVCLNSATAEKKDLKDGDKIQVESRYGKVEGRVRVSELFHPDAVGIAGCYGVGTRQSNPLNRRGPNFNSLITTDDHTLDGVSAGQEMAPRVKITKKR